MTNKTATTPISIDGTKPMVCQNKANGKIPAA